MQEGINKKPMGRLLKLNTKNNSVNAKEGGKGRIGFLKWNKYKKKV